MRTGLYIREAFLLSLTVIYFCSCSNQPKEEKEFLSMIGICTSVNNHAIMYDHGYDFIEEGLQGFLKPLEPHDAFAENLERAQNSSLPVRATNVFLPGHLKVTGPDAVHDQVLAYADTAFRRAEMVGIKSIVFGSGGARRIPDGFDKEEATNQFVDLLKKMGPIAEKYNVTVAIEPLNRNEVNFINTVAEGLEIVKKVDHPNIRLLADFFHMLREEEPVENILNARGYINHVHIAELENRTPPGIAGDDFRPYLRALKEIGYEGMISIEGRWDNFEEQLPVAIAELRRQIEEVRAE
jgi:sugar phosphate isomerase/epimerase